MFGRVEMPPIVDDSYFVTLGPHSFYWFVIEPQKVPIGRASWGDGEEVPLRTVRRSWEELFEDDEKSVLTAELPAFLQGQRWFSGKGRRLRSIAVEEALPIRRDGPPIYLTFVNVQYSEGTGETYFLPLTYSTGEDASLRLRQSPQAVVLRIKSPAGQDGILYDAVFDDSLSKIALRAISIRQRLKAGSGELVGSRTPTLRQLTIDEPMRVSLLRGEQTNTSVVFNDKLLLKFFRKVEAGVNPDLEIGRLLTSRGFASSPRVAGAIEYYRGSDEPMTLAILHEFIRIESDAWQYTLDSLRDFLDLALSAEEELPTVAPVTGPNLLRLIAETMPPLVLETIGSFVESARLLGQRTAELHGVLGSVADDAAFAPEPFTPFYQRSLYQSMRNLTTNSFLLLNRFAGKNPDAPPQALQVSQLEGEVLRRFRALVSRNLRSMRIRSHGDYHLGQVLFTGNDFLITDFEGEPQRTISERRLKRSPLRDVAGMLRSFSYAVHSALIEREESGLEDGASVRAREWGRFWQAWVSTTYLASYLEHAGRSGSLTTDKDEIALLLDIYMLEKAVYEIGYELNNRPGWVVVPLEGILDLLQAES
jgi:maltose alpha-D-glucosyltransferase/alpha-amylase